MVRSALILLPFLIAFAGCRNSRSELIEAELRTKDRELRELQGRLQHTELINEALERDLLHGRAPARGESRPTVSAVLKEIVLGRGTGGVDDDRQLGDDALQIVVTPRDEDTSPVKAVGALRVEAFEISTQGTKAHFGFWDVTPTQLRQTWRQGLFSTGFHVVLGWKHPPSTERMRVVVQLLLPDGRVFEADRDISIRLAPAPANVLPVPKLHEEPLSSMRPAELGKPRAVNRP